MTTIDSKEVVSQPDFERPSAERQGTDQQGFDRPGFEQFELIAQRVAARPADSDPDLSWRQVASCRDTSPELFFPIGTTGQAIDQIEAAKVVCMSCPAQVPCLEFALSTNQDSGVWGATSEEDRRHLRRTYLSRRR